MFRKLFHPDPPTGGAGGDPLPPSAQEVKRLREAVESVDVSVRATIKVVESLTARLGVLEAKLLPPVPPRRTRLFGGGE